MVEFLQESGVLNVNTFYCHKQNVEQMDEVTADNCEKVFFVSLPDQTKFGVLGLVLTQVSVAKL